MDKIQLEFNDNYNKNNFSKKFNILEKALYDVEHAIGMYATSFLHLSAKNIYNKKLLEQEYIKDIIESCHIYFIGFFPSIQFLKPKQVGRILHLEFSVLKNKYIIEEKLKDGLILTNENSFYYLQNELGEKFWYSESDLFYLLNNKYNVLNFNVQYIGQSYGKDGSRNAIDRLLKHETLQKISLKGIPNGFELSLLLLEIQPNTQIFTTFNPFAQNESGNSRIKSGLDKLYNTNEQERIALYEASFIRYFQPFYNKEFKDSFPSTNLKILQDCYNKDFAAVIAEICFIDFPYYLYSESVKPSLYHIAKYDLHKDSDRKTFFSL